MEHHFLIEDAKKHKDIATAVIIYNIRYWLRKNVANKKHQHDGRYWTYNSVKAFSDLFPYLTEKQIYSRLKKLEDSGYLIVGNYNKVGYDQTKWYSINEEEFKTFKEAPILPHGKMDLPSGENGLYPEVKPIPDIKPDVNPDIKLICDFEDFWNLYALKKGKEKSIKLWNKLSDKDKALVMENVPIFKTHYNKDYLPHPRTYLYNKYWLDEAFQKVKTENNSKQQQEKPIANARAYSNYAP